MDGAVKRRFNSLSFKMSLFVSFLILPLNILLIIAAILLMHNMEQELMLSYQHELAVYGTELDDSMAMANKKLTELTREDLSLISEENSMYELAIYDFWQELKTIRQDNVMLLGAFLKTEWDQKVYISCDSSVSEYSQIEQMYQWLKTSVLEPSGDGTFQSTEVEGSLYLYDVRKYPDFSFGFVYTADRLTEGLRLSGNGRYYLVPDQTDHGLSEEGYQVAYKMKSVNGQLIRYVSKTELNTAIPWFEKGLFVLGICSILLIPVLYIQIQRLVLRPLKRLEHAMEEIQNQNFQYRIDEHSSSNEFYFINRMFNHMVTQINEMTIAVFRKEIEKHEIEENNLRLQINPHMLLNSLNMICSLAYSQNYQCIVNFSTYLIRYFQYVLRKKDRFVTVSSEMDFVENYLQIQKIRFPGQFTSVYVIEPELEDCLIPPLMIQNFVENSVKYGLTFESVVEIIVVIAADGDMLRISVCDSGAGMSPEILKNIRGGSPYTDENGEHIGIWNCRRRLKMYYGDDTELTVSSRVGEGTQVWFRVPMMWEKSKGEENESADRR